VNCNESLRLAGVPASFLKIRPIWFLYYRLTHHLCFYFFFANSYTPLDWLTSLGFVPPERWAAWQRIDPVLPRVRRDGPFTEDSAPTAQVWREQGPALLQHIKHSEL
jgi:hypothetical protein